MILPNCAGKQMTQCTDVPVLVLYIFLEELMVFWYTRHITTQPPFVGGMGRLAGMHAGRQVGGQTPMLAGVHTGREIGRQASTQGAQAGRQINTDAQERR